MKSIDRNETVLDTTTSVPSDVYNFTWAARTKLERVLMRPAAELFKSLILDIESEDSQLLSLALVQSMFRQCSDEAMDGNATPEGIAHWIGGKRQSCLEHIAKLRGQDGSVDAQFLKCRAPVALVAGCWLDRISQPATEPAYLVSLLMAQRLILKGGGEYRAGELATRRRLMEGHGVYIPDITSMAFEEACESPDCIFQDAAFYLALSRLPASFMPEVIGLHYAHYSLAIDDHILGGQVSLPIESLEGLLTSFFDMVAKNSSPERDIKRFIRGVQIGVKLAERSLEATAKHAQARLSRSLADKMAGVIKRHMPYAGRHHAAVLVGDRRLPDWFDKYDEDEINAFLTSFSRSRLVKPNAKGSCPFLEATKFEGSMFGLFSEEESEVLAAWVQEAHADIPAMLLSGFPKKDQDIGVEDVGIHGLFIPENVIWEEPGTPDDRTLLHRLVNIELHANTLTLARHRIERNLLEAEQLFIHGKAGQFTDASWLPWDREGLENRMDEIYWCKLVNPWKRLTNVPDREAVIFGQKLAALGSLLDGCWIHRVGSVVRSSSSIDAMLYGIYSDEMGRGEIRKNHIVLIQRVLSSMSIALPHIRDIAFVDQDELPDLYEFPLHQLGLSLFPDTFYPEILGYNLGIEMLGLGEMRLHEIQKLRRYGLDTVYEEAHLTIDNYSTGHARQSLNLIEMFMEGKARSVSPEETASIWRRVWRGYASFAWFIETDLKKTIECASIRENTELTI